SSRAEFFSTINHLLCACTVLFVARGPLPATYGPFHSLGHLPIMCGPNPHTRTVFILKDSSGLFGTGSLHVRTFFSTSGPFCFACGLFSVPDRPLLTASGAFCDAR